MKHTGTLFIVALLVLAVAPTYAGGATIRVPQDHPTIQGAIDAAASGDIILVARGTYVENIDFSGKRIEVRSEEGPAVTTIDGNQAGPVVIISAGEPYDTILDGFTITNGYAPEGGGIFCLESSPTIRKNTITENTADRGGGIRLFRSNAVIVENTITANVATASIGGRGWGGGILWDSFCFPLIERNFISSNTAFIGGGIVVGVVCGGMIRENVISDNLGPLIGGGVYCDSQSSPTITRNLTSDNVSSHGGGIFCDRASTPLISCNVIARNSANAAGGGGIVCWNTSVPSILHNTIVDNLSAAGKGGGILVSHSTPTIANTIVWGNDAREGSQIFVDGGQTPTIMYCDIEGGWPGTGNIDDDPLFVDVEGGDYHLLPASPCIDSGSDTIPGLSDRDCDGDHRFLDGDLDGDVATDIGADEHLPCRFGTVNKLGASLADVLFVNGSPGDSRRIQTLGVTTPLTITMVRPPQSPNPAHFALYVWVGAPDATSSSAQPKDLGIMCFPTPVTGGSPQPKKIWNNIGHEEHLGPPDYPSDPAPSTVFDLPNGVGFPVTATLQGFIMDDNSGAKQPASITNAIILVVGP